MTDLITRCPKCATAFNVTETHLKTANGAVRCGSCLSVFNGRENLVHTLTQKSNPLLDKDDLLVSDDFVKEHQPTPPSYRAESEPHSDEHDDDESWALKLLEEEGHDPKHLGLGASSSQKEDAHLDKDDTQDGLAGIALSASDIATASSAPADTVSLDSTHSDASSSDAVGSNALDSNSAARKIATPATSQEDISQPDKRSGSNKRSLLDIEFKGAESYDTTIVIPTEAYEKQAEQNALTDITITETVAIEETAFDDFSVAPEAASEESNAKESVIEDSLTEDKTSKESNNEGESVSASLAYDDFTAKKDEPEQKEESPQVIIEESFEQLDSHSLDALQEPLDQEARANSAASESNDITFSSSNKPTPAARKAEEYVASKAGQPEPEAIIDEKDLEELQEVIDAAQNQNNTVSHALSDSIEAEAVELQYTAKRSAWLGKVLWFVLALVAALALAAQVAWLKFDDWSAKAPYREYYILACEHLGCSVPQLKDMSKIRTSNLLVRSHPSTENALLVDVVLQNHAAFKQPFPKLVLVFSNIKNKVIASRAFEPTEYLGGDLQGASMMPIRKPIHLSLELVDPGKEADSYKIMVEE